MNQTIFLMSLLCIGSTLSTALDAPWESENPETALALQEGSRRRPREEPITDRLNQRNVRQRTETDLAQPSFVTHPEEEEYSASNNLLIQRAHEASDFFPLWVKKNYRLQWRDGRDETGPYSIKAYVSLAKETRCPIDGEMFTRTEEDILLGSTKYYHDSEETDKWNHPPEKHYSLKEISWYIRGVRDEKGAKIKRATTLSEKKYPHSVTIKYIPKLQSVRFLSGHFQQTFDIEETYIRPDQGTYTESKFNITIPLIARHLGFKNDLKKKKSYQVLSLSIEGEEGKPIYPGYVHKQNPLNHIQKIVGWKDNDKHLKSIPIIKITIKCRGLVGDDAPIISEYSYEKKGKPRKYKFKKSFGISYYERPGKRRNGDKQNYYPNAIINALSEMNLIP